MNLNQLSCLLALERHRHFGRAAQACGVTQPALSMQLRKLEEELGAPLFERSRAPVEPTDLGREVVEQARRVLDEAERLREIVREHGREVAGELRLGVIPTLGPYLLPALLSRVLQRHRGLSVRVEELQTEQIFARLREAELDAALVASAPWGAGLVETTLFREPFVGYVAEGHRLHSEERLRVEDLRLEDLWLLSEGHCLRDQVVKLCAKRTGEPPSGMGALHFESGNLATLKRLVEHSGGMTLLPQLAVAGLSEEERRRVRPFAEPAPAREIRLVRRQSYLKRRLIEVLTQELQRFRAELPPVPEDLPMG